MLTASLISTVIGTMPPGPGSISMQQEMRFSAPVYIGDTVTARAELVELIREKQRIRLRTTRANQEGKIVLDGEALVSAPRG